MQKRCPSDSGQEGIEQKIKMNERTAIVALSRVKGIDRARKRQIAEEYDRISVLFEDCSLIRNPIVKQAISTFEGWEEIGAELSRLDKMGAEVITIKDGAYPESLKRIPDPPLVLYKRGNLSAGDNSLAIVGSRQATVEGIHLSEKIGETLSSLGITIISGLAKGIDASAHR